jgi:hypothetical protein
MKDIHKKVIILFVCVVIFIILRRKKNTTVDNSDNNNIETMPIVPPPTTTTTTQPPSQPNTTGSVVFHVLGKANPLKDNAKNHYVGMYGRVTIDSSTSARCGTSGFFNGNAYLFAYFAPHLRLDRDFTVQGWAKITAVTGFQYVFSYGHYTKGIMIRPGSPSGDSLYINGIQIGDINACFPVNVWVFFTLSRSGDTVRFYANGNLILTYGTPLGTIYADATSSEIQIGGHVGVPDYEKFHGYLEDIRVVNGSAIDGTIVPSGPLPSALAS